MRTEHVPYQHGFVLNVFLGVEPALGAPPPHVGPHDGAEHWHVSERKRLPNYRCQIRHAISLLQLTDDALPGPEGREDGPPGPRLQDAVQLEGVEDGEDEEAAEHHELGRVEVLQIIVSLMYHQNGEINLRAQIEPETAP